MSREGTAGWLKGSRCKNSREVRHKVTDDAIDFEWLRVGRDFSVTDKLTGEVTPWDGVETHVRVHLMWVLIRPVPKGVLVTVDAFTVPWEKEFLMEA